jgi:hypothetical protein
MFFYGKIRQHCWKRVTERLAALGKVHLALKKLAEGLSLAY